MSDTARDYPTPAAASTEGLQDLFDVEVDPSNTEGLPGSPTKGVSVEEASRILGLSPKTIKDRLRKGTLEGFKARNKYGETWMVSLRRDAVVTLTPTEMVDPDSQVSPKTESLVLLELLNRKDKELEAAAFRNGYLEAQLADQIKLLPDLEAKANQAETLKLQLAALEAEVQKYRSVWWRRFGNWFIGRKSESI